LPAVQPVDLLHIINAFTQRKQPLGKLLPAARNFAEQRIAAMPPDALPGFLTELARVRFAIIAYWQLQYLEPCVRYRGDAMLQHAGQCCSAAHGS
jgi:hypothetical protein